MARKFNTMKRLMIILIGLSIGTNALAQQNTQYSQYMFNGLYINPGYAGYKEALNMNTYYRSQWTGVEGGPKTMAVAIDNVMHNDKIGLGLNVIHDKVGNERNLSIYANYAYRLRLGEDPNKRLAFGIGAGLLNTGFDNAGVITNEQELIHISNTIMPDVRFGIYYSSMTFFAGLSMDNMLSTAIFNGKTNYNGIPPVRQYYLSVGGIIPLSYDILFKPSTLIKHADKGGNRALSTDLNAAIIFAERFTVGATYRTALSSKNPSMENRKLPLPNAFIALLEFKATSNFKVGYSFDYTLNDVQTQLGSTHEISIGYTFDRKRERMKTPRFF